MKSLREELESRRSKGEPDLFIKYVKGSPTIVSKYSHPSKNAEHFFILNILYQNVRGLLTKLIFFTDFLIKC